MNSTLTARAARGAIALALLLPALTARLPAAGGDVVEMTAADFEFTPAKVVAHVGRPVTLHIVTKLGTHGVASSELGIDKQLLVEGRPVDVTFTPSKAGTFTVHCANVCGIGHEGMLFQVEVDS